MISKSKTKIHDIDFLYEIHDGLTDKKLLKTITREEEEQFEKIRDEIVSSISLKSINLEHIYLEVIQNNDY